jgi:molybdenum cofactor biosynthesis enzyme MoaA
MNYNISTLSICEHCYRHIPATKYEENKSIWITKTCPTHGQVTHLIEPDAEFYLDYVYEKIALQSYFLEITNRCNLNCPHCYQMPDNGSIDDSLDDIIKKIISWPDNGYPVALVGAEPTMRKDLLDIIKKIKSLPGKTRDVMILTNGVKLASETFAKQFENIPGVMWTFGLNHKTYQGLKVREKQIEGIKNCLKFNLPIKNISYTLLNISQLEDCITELVDFGLTYCQQYRIRCGADIGRTPGDEQLYLSQLLTAAEKICKEKNYSFVRKPRFGNRAHYPVEINGIPVKIIQWPDVKTLDLSEIQTEAIADILPDKPPSPLVHQVILRDGAVNKGLPLLDTIPSEWIENYGFTKRKNEND